MRLIIEPQTAAGAATNASESELKNIRLAHEAAVAATAPEDYEPADTEFHRAIFMSTRNQFLHDLHDMLLVIRSREPMVEMRRRNFSQERRLAYSRQHGAIVEALIARDSAEAAKAMRAHLMARCRDLFGELKGRGHERDSPAPQPFSAAGDDLAAIMQRMTGASPLDIMNVRMFIEPQAAAAAASNTGEPDLAGIAEAHEEAAKSFDMEVFERWDAEFHKRIFASTRNEFLTILHDILSVIRNRTPWREIKRRTFSEERRLAYCVDHALIVETLAARDAERAALAMRAHLAAVSANLFGNRGVG